MTIERFENTSKKLLFIKTNTTLVTVNPREQGETSRKTTKRIWVLATNLPS